MILNSTLEAESMNEMLLVVRLETGVASIHVVLAHVGGVLASARSTAILLS